MVSLEIFKNYNDEEGLWEVQLVGDADIQTSSKLKDELSAMLDENETGMRLDCDKLSYIDSTGLGVLIGILKRVKTSGKDITILKAQANMKKLLSITGLDKIFVII
jgi:anti-sigma B factor antagonist